MLLWTRRFLLIHRDKSESLYRMCLKSKIRGQNLKPYVGLSLDFSEINAQECQSAGFMVVFGVIRKCQSVFPGSCAILHAHRQCAS